MVQNNKLRETLSTFVRLLKKTCTFLICWQVPDLPPPVFPVKIKYKENDIKPLYGHIENFYKADELSGVFYMGFTAFFLFLSIFFLLGRVWILSAVAIYLFYKFAIKSFGFLKQLNNWKKKKKQIETSGKKYIGRVVGVERDMKMAGSLYSSWPEAVYRLRVGFVQDGALKIITTPDLSISPSFIQPLSCVVYEYLGEYLVDNFLPCSAVFAQDDTPDLKTFLMYSDIPHEFILDTPGANAAFTYGGYTFVTNYIENVPVVSENMVEQIISVASEYNNAIACLIAPDGEFSAEAINLARRSGVLLIYRELLRNMDMKSIIIQFMSQKNLKTIDYLYEKTSPYKYWTLADMEQRYGISRYHIVSDFHKAGLPNEDWNGIGPYVYPSNEVIAWERKTKFVKLVSTNGGMVILP